MLEVLAKVALDRMEIPKLCNAETVICIEETKNLLYVRIEFNSEEISTIPNQENVPCRIQTWFNDKMLYTPDFYEENNRIHRLDRDQSEQYVRFMSEVIAFQKLFVEKYQYVLQKVREIE